MNVVSLMRTYLVSARPRRQSKIKLIAIAGLKWRTNISYGCMGAGSRDLLFRLRARELVSCRRSVAVSGTVLKTAGPPVFFVSRLGHSGDEPVVGTIVSDLAV